LVVVVGQGFAEAGDAHGPLAGLARGVLKLAADVHFRNFAGPAFAADAALVAEAAQVVALVDCALPEALLDDAAANEIIDDSAVTN